MQPRLEIFIPAGTECSSEVVVKREIGMDEHCFIVETCARTYSTTVSSPLTLIAPRAVCTAETPATDRTSSAADMRKKAATRHAVMSGFSLLKNCPGISRPSKIQARTTENNGCRYMKWMLSARTMITDTRSPESADVTRT